MEEIISKDIYNIKGLLANDECLLLHRLAGDVVDRFGKDAVLCEIGSFYGKSTVAIATALKSSQGGHLYAIDWHQGSQNFPGYEAEEDVCQSSYTAYQENLRKYDIDQWVTTIQLKSQEAFDKVPGKIHFLWIDGAHDYDSVKSDYENYQKKLVAGGYLLFHDASWTEFREPFELIRDEVLYNENYNLYAIVENILVFKKEKNKTRKLYLRLLQYVCLFVAGSGRPFYKRGISAVLRIVTSWCSWRVIFNKTPKA